MGPCTQNSLVWSGFVRLYITVGPLLPYAYACRFTVLKGRLRDLFGELKGRKGKRFQRYYVKDFSEQ